MTSRPDSADDPHARPSSATGRRRLGRWLGRLAEIGLKLVKRMGYLAEHRRADGAVPEAAMAPGPGRIDLHLAWDLVKRAMRWTHALRARLAAESKVARAAVSAARGRAAWPRPPHDDLGWNRNGFPRPVPPARPRPDPCIDGKSEAEIMAQICADLGVAAAMLRSPSAAAEIAEIVAAARAVLGGRDAVWMPLPVSDLRHRAAGEVKAAATPVPLVDTG